MAEVNTPLNEGIVTCSKWHPIIQTNEKRDNHKNVFIGDKGLPLDDVQCFVNGPNRSLSDHLDESQTKRRLPVAPSAIHPHIMRNNQCVSCNNCEETASRRERVLGTAVPVNNCDVLNELKEITNPTLHKTEAVSPSSGGSSWIKCELHMYICIFRKDNRNGTRTIKDIYYITYHIGRIDESSTAVLKLFGLLHPYIFNKYSRPIDTIR